jgi:Mg2+/Co2+ transporter CorC
MEHFFQQTREQDEESAELNTELFENALSLPMVKIRQCLVPRTEIEACELLSPIETLQQQFIQTQLSKLVIYDDNIDSIVKNKEDDDFMLLIMNYFKDVKRGNSNFSQEGKTLSEFVISLLQFALVIQHNKKFQSIEDKSFKAFYTQCAFLTEELVPKKFIKNNWHDHI